MFDHLPSLRKLEITGNSKLWSPALLAEKVPRGLQELQVILPDRRVAQHLVAIVSRVACLEALSLFCMVRARAHAEHVRDHRHPPRAGGRLCAPAAAHARRMQGRARRRRHQARTDGRLARACAGGRGTRARDPRTPHALYPPRACPYPNLSQAHGGGAVLLFAPRRADVRVRAARGADAVCTQRQCAGTGRRHGRGRGRGRGAATPPASAAPASGDGCAHRQRHDHGACTGRERPRKPESEHSVCAAPRLWPRRPVATQAVGVRDGRVHAPAPDPRAFSAVGPPRGPGRAPL